MQPLPTADGVSLDDVDVPDKWLLRCEKRQHSLKKQNMPRTKRRQGAAPESPLAKRFRVSSR
jgi:hypothetical protein